MPKISIVIPVYNAEKFLEETLDSVINQTFDDFECVIVNDGSTDKSLEIINSYVELDERFKIFTIPNSGCANMPRNIAIRNSFGEFIFYLDADDLIESDTLEKLLNRQQETNADIVILRMIGCVNELKGELWRLPLSTFDMNTELSGVEACDLTIGSWQIPCNGLFKKKLFENIHAGSYMNSDEIASRYLLYNAQKVVFIDTKYFYRNNINSITKSISYKIFDRLMTDEQLDLFISERFDLTSNTCLRLRNTRLFNMIYLQYDFLKYSSLFAIEKRKEIALNFRKVYNSQKLNLLRKELPIIMGFLFALSYPFFKLSSFVYVSIKDRNRRKYFMK